jgi:EAL domain-containing protein (putative c-di-GMP-specific phosphodiesterase class I)/PAS domain-containing protein
MTPQRPKGAPIMLTSLLNGQEDRAPGAHRRRSRLGERMRGAIDAHVADPPPAPSAASPTADGSILAAAFEHAPTPMALLGPHGEIHHVNRRLRQLAGDDGGGSAIRSLASLLHGDDVELVRSACATAPREQPLSLRVRVIDRGGAWAWASATVTAIEGEVDQLILHFGETLEPVGPDPVRDPDSGLWEREPFEAALAWRVSRTRGTGESAGVLLLSAAVGAGDAGPREAVARLAQVVRGAAGDGALLARFGELIVAALLPAAGSEEARRRLARVRAAVMAEHGTPVPVGTAVVERTSRSAREVLAAAERELLDGPLADPDPFGELAWREDWSSRIRTALADGRLALEAQPVVSCDGGDIVQHELLLRLVESEQLVAPGRFLAAAAQSGLATELDRWVITAACSLCAAHPGRPLSINLSASSLGDPVVGEFIEQELRRGAIDPAMLTFEVAERDAVTFTAEAIALSRRLRPLGCGLALDGFGASWHSIGQLRDLRVDAFKIDPSFVRAAGRSAADRLAIAAIRQLARGSGALCVATGVEDADTAHLLTSLGVDQLQGFHLARPARVEAGLERVTRAAA